MIIEQNPPTFRWCVAWVSITIGLFLCTLLLPSCTLSFQNISTHGTATDLVDENQAATADPQLSIPAKL